MGPISHPTKSDMRAAALARREALSVSERSRAAQAMAQRLAGLPLPAGPLALYWPIRSEADPRPAARILAGEARPLCLPAVTQDGLVFRLWAPGGALESGPFGLCEPPENAPAVTPAALIVPLAAFDRRGHRIGYGKGFYDRALARLGPVMTIGLAFAIQEIPLVPDEAHDRRLDFVVTERETIDTRTP
jgi:5-formyltetrahydrofolate cyclo-ligase